MSSPNTTPTQRSQRNKRRRDEQEGGATPIDHRALNSSPPVQDSSLPPTPYDEDDEEEVIVDEEAEMRARGRRDLPDDEDEEDEEDEDGDEEEDEEDEEGEDLFQNDTLMNDYTGNMRLDRYSDVDIDDRSSIPEMTRGQRQAAEREMARRDRGVGGVRRARTHMPEFLQSEDGDDLSGDAGLLSGISRHARRRYDELPDELAEEEEIPLEHLADIKTRTVPEWLAIPQVRRAVATHFRTFLTTVTDDMGGSVYGARIRTLGETNAESLEVSYVQLSDKRPVLSYFLANSPQATLAIFDEVALEAVLMYFPGYNNIHSEIHVRISDVPLTVSLRDLRQDNLNGLVRVKGVVTRRTGVFPQLKYVKFDCSKCGATLGPFYQDVHKELKLSFCSNCTSRGPFTVNSEQTVYRNFQKLTLQESPGSVPAGRLPRHREVILMWDLIDVAKPGEEIEVTGTYRNNFDAALNSKNGFPVFATVLEANHITKAEDAYASINITAEEEKTIRALSKDDRIAKRIVKSIAPSIYGHDDIKTAIALSLFGGCAKDINRKHRIRGDINVLLLGDPGTAKSQFLKYVEKTANRAVFTTGQGASAVGLTASVRKDPITREWTLEGGALVLADKGHCLIDEFDKMNDADRTSIHEAMEQQSISISKAGIVTTLQARCAIVAAANPIGGRYNPTIPFQQNVELTEPILSRFDVLCVVKDPVDPVQDEMLAQFVVGSHIRSHPLFEAEHEEMAVNTVLDADIIEQDMLRKYIMYAKDNVRPKLYQLDQDKLARLYADLRRESLATGSFPITVRHLESMIRMAEASAKMHLREFVRSDDIDLAIRVTIGSFVSAQKMSIKKSLQRGFRKYVTASGDTDELLNFLLGQLVKERVQIHWNVHGSVPPHVEVKVPLLETRARTVDVFDVRPYLASALFRTNGYVVHGNVIRKDFVVGE